MWLRERLAGRLNGVRRSALGRLVGAGLTPVEADDAFQELTLRAMAHDTAPVGEDEFRRWVFALCRYEAMAVRSARARRARAMLRFGAERIEHEQVLTYDVGGGASPSCST